MCISVIAPVKSVPEPIIRATHARTLASTNKLLPQNRMCSHRSLPPDADADAQVLSHVPPSAPRPSASVRPSDRFLSFTLRALRSAAKNFAGRTALIPRLCFPRPAPRDAGPRQRDEGGNDGGGGGRRQSRGGMPDGQTHFRSEEVEGG